MFGQSMLIFSKRSRKILLHFADFKDSLCTCKGDALTGQQHLHIHQLTSTGSIGTSAYSCTALDVTGQIDKDCPVGRYVERPGIWKQPSGGGHLHLQ